MPYRRSIEAPSPDKMVAAFETAIRSLVRRFRNHPYAFYTETDMHCYLYHRLYRPLFNGLYRTSEGHDTILLHKEYPTVSRYAREASGHLRTDPAGRRRGHFDISIWDPAFIRDRAHREQKVLCAAELALNECDAASVHTVNDATKLADAGNEIRYGYLLYFVRDDPVYARNEPKIRRELSDAAKRVRVVLARVEGTFKPKPEFLGAWGTV